MSRYLDHWIPVATALFAQALTGEPALSEGLPKPLSVGSFGFAATISGDEAGRFSVVLDGAVLEAELVGEGVHQKGGWKEILREVADAAAGDLLAKTGCRCKVESFEEIVSENKVTRAFQLTAGERSFSILVRDELRAPRPDAKPAESKPEAAQPARPATAAPSQPAAEPVFAAAGVAPGIELLLDVELDASLRFGCREMPLGEILDLGPGDVVQLDRHVADPVDLIVGDKIVARGEVVLVNGNFGLRVTEVASPRRRLESIRCLF